jgi:hypothetical protein
MYRPSLKRVSVGRLVVIGWTMTGLSCASHGVPHTAVDESQPHISWDIRADRGGTEVCGSAMPGVNCVLARSTDERRSSVGVHVLLHSVATEAQYLGVVRAPFIEGGTLRGVGEINVTVRPNGDPVNATTSSGVTKEPGQYTLSIALDAIQEGQPPVRIVQDIPVLVK